MKKITVEKLRTALQRIEKLGDELTSLRADLGAAGDFKDKLKLADDLRAKDAELSKLLLDASPLLFGRTRTPAKDKPAAAPKAAKAARKPRAAKPKASEDANITEAFVELVGDKLTKTPQKESALAKALDATPKAVLAALMQLGTGDKPRAKRVRKGLWTKA